MNLTSLIPSGCDLLALAPEDLSIAVLRTLKDEEAQERRRNPHRAANIALVNYCNHQAQQYADVPREECGYAISAAFHYLVTIGMLAPNPQSSPYGWFVLTPRAASIQTDADYDRFRHAARYPRGAIHPLIEHHTYSEFLKGDYDTAVFKAFKTVEDFVRKRAGYGNEVIGVPMMRKAFHPDTGPLTDKSEHEGEREALMHLMSGAIGRFKNPSSHRFTGLDDPLATLEILHLASLLLRVADRQQSPA